MIDYTKLKPREILEKASTVAGFFTTPEQWARQCSSPWDEDDAPVYHPGRSAMWGRTTIYGTRGQLAGWTKDEWNPLRDLDQAIALQLRHNLTVAALSRVVLVSPERGYPVVSVTAKSGSVRAKQEAMQRAITLFAAVHIAGKPVPKKPKRRRKVAVNLYDSEE